MVSSLRMLVNTVLQKVNATIIDHATGLVYCSRHDALRDFSINIALLKCGPLDTIELLGDIMRGIAGQSSSRK